MKYYLAIDLGASSGRHVIGYLKDGEVVLKEIYRFKTGMSSSADGLVWNIPLFLKEIKNGIKKAFDLYKDIESLSIDTWGVDYVLMDKDKEIPPFYAYRNSRCVEASEKVHKIIAFEKLYYKTGIQFASFNTIYQLFDDLKKGRLKKATDYLMLPSYFSYKLTGVKTHEYTEESTGALLDPSKKDYNFEVIDAIGLPRKLFNKIENPGKFVGYLTPEVQKEVGGNTKVILCASHDTGSAFESIDAPDDGVILSSGTWSLLGIKSSKPIVNKASLSANYTNEGGVGYIRFLKNIMGMYIANRVSEETQVNFRNINVLKESKYTKTFDVNDKSLMAPEKMKEAVLKLLKKDPPTNIVDLYSSIYHSLALSYKKAIDELEEITGNKYNSIYIVGGGAKNKNLNKIIEKETNRKVVALPIEATAYGNIKIQMKASKELWEEK